MASVVTAAPMDGAPLLALHKPNKHFGATHALKLVIGKRPNYGVKHDQPTVGLDVGAKTELHRMLASLLPKGGGVIMVSCYQPGARARRYPARLSDGRTRRKPRT